MIDSYSFENIFFAEFNKQTINVSLYAFTKMLLLH